MGRIGRMNVPIFYGSCELIDRIGQAVTATRSSRSCVDFIILLCAAFPIPPATLSSMYGDHINYFKTTYLRLHDNPGIWLVVQDLKIAFITTFMAIIHLLKLEEKS